MGYTIMYAKQFVKLDENHTLPVILCGSNNCTMFVGGREVREKEWQIWNSDVIKMDNLQLKEYFEKMNVSSYELFKEGNKWIYGKDIDKWFRNAMSKAKYLEEILLQRPNQYLHISVGVYNADTNKTKWISNDYCKTTQEIVSALSVYDNCSAGEKESKFLAVEFNGRESLKLSNVDFSKPFICKNGSMYVSSFSSGAVNSCRDKSKAYVFSNLNEVKNIRWIGELNFYNV